MAFDPASMMEKHTLIRPSAAKHDGGLLALLSVLFPKAMGGLKNEVDSNYI